MTPQETSDCNLDVMASFAAAPWLDPKIMCADCLIEMAAMPDKSVAAIITDPPYMITSMKWDVAQDWQAWWAQAKRVCNGVVVMTSSQPFTTDLINSNRAGFKYEWIWKKSRPTGIAQAKYQPMKIHETVLVFAMGKTTFNPIKEARQYKGSKSTRKPWETRNYGNNHGLNPTANQMISAERNPTTVLEFPSLSPFPKGNILHPTQKPVELMRYLVRTYTNSGQTVLDPFCGSGTTCLAAMLEGRESIGIEKETNYAQIAINRITKARGLGV